ncbi:TPA: hypothetical protein JAN72_14990 [Legionella pneumophila]|nr:hypothetical protein [Legionella pneumophila]HEN4771458.1 DUF4935 domain-containing protein [Legionella pneumophila]
MNIFLDNGVLLDFYRVSSNEAELYKKVNTLIENNAVSIYLTEQVKHEFTRMKEDIIQQALDDFSSLKVSLNTPPIFSLDDEFRDLSSSAKIFNEKLDSLHIKFNKQFLDNKLEADTLIDIIFSKAKFKETTPELLQKAKVRMEIRNPPGKINELGDRLNWETLLNWSETNNEYSGNKDNDFYIISNDGDYFRETKNKNTEIKLFLQDEWSAAKSNKLFGFKTLKEFFIQKFPNQKLATDLEHEVLVSKLENSGNFSTTHYVIEKLTKIDHLNDKHVNRIVEAYIENDQINRILCDNDVSSYLNSILKKYDSIITDSNREKVIQLKSRS